jgi:hypothetical protein
LQRIFKPGFLAKMLRTNAPGMYGWRTLLYGTLLPGPQIARSFPEHLRALAAAGHEIGVHGYDHVYWHDRLNGLGADATTAELRRGLAVFAELTGTPATAFAAPGWQCTANSLAAIDAAGLRYHSCTRGARRTGRWPAGASSRRRRFRRRGHARRGVRPRRHRCGDAERVLSRAGPARSERPYESTRRSRGCSAATRSRLDALRGHVEFVRLIDVAGALDRAALPRCPVGNGTVEGRAGTVAVQGAPA